MAISRVQAERLCNASEFQLYQASTRDRIGSLKPAQLKQKIDRTRKLRDKNRDLYQRQQIALKKSGAKGGGAVKPSNARTDQKAQLFEETLARFEKRLAALEKAAAKTSSKPAAPKGKAAVKAKPKSKAAAKAKPKAKAKPTVKAKAKAAAKAKPAAKAKAATKKAVAPSGGKKTILTSVKAKASSAKAKAKSKTTHMSRSASKKGREQDLQKMRGKAIQGHVRARGQRKQAKRDKR